MQNTKGEEDETIQPFNLKVAIIYSILSFISFVLSTILLVWMVVKQYGVFASSPLVISTCTNTYFEVKYSNSNVFIAMFAFLIVSIAASLTMTIIWIANVIKSRVSQKIKYVTVILESIKCLSSAVFLGYCLTFLIELSKMNSNACSISYNSDILVLLIGIAATNFILSMVRYFIAASREFISEKQVNEVPKTVQNYQSLVNVSNESFRENEKTMKQSYLNQVVQIRKFEKTLPKVVKPPTKIRYIGESQIVNSAEWETLAPSRVSQKPQPRPIYKKEASLAQNKSQKNKRDSPFEDKLDKNIFLDIESQVASQNQPLFIPQQPFYYKSLAGRTLGKPDKHPNKMPKSTSMKKMQLSGQIFQMDEEDQQKKEKDLRLLRIRSQKLNLYTPKIIRQNYERRLNKII